jgi:homoserine kinase
MRKDPFLIRVPASTANLGPGFDSIGLAVNLFLEIEVRDSDRWEVISHGEGADEFACDESNFICQTALKAAAKFGKDLPPCQLKVMSDIPLAKGLGSSAAAIVAGIELANHKAQLNLTQSQKLELATEIEGHPDNVGASLYGGLFIGSKLGEEVYATSMPNLQFELVAVIPKEPLLTKLSRSVLPENVAFSQAVTASSVANLLVAALLQGNWNLAGEMMKRDRFHQPYRKQLVPHFEAVEQFGLENGAFGVFISGAGPTVLSCCEPGKGQELASLLGNEFTEMDIKLLQIESFGSRAIENCEFELQQVKRV